jgi:integrase
MADIRPIESHMKKIIEWGGNRDPHSLTRHDAQDFITFLADLAPGSVRRYNDTFKLLLDEADCDPNPARDSRVKLPRMTAEEPTPPTGRQFLAILDTVPRRYRLPFCVQEQCGMHIGEVASLAWGDVDVAESRSA